MTDDNVTQLPTKKNEVLNNIWEEVMKAENKIEELEEQISLVELIGAAPSGPEISVACDEIKRLLLEKNIAYGNSALSPIQIFAKAGVAEGIANRIDDKLNRIKNAQSYPGDNDVDDLIGYLILYKISQSS